MRKILLSLAILGSWLLGAGAFIGFLLPQLQPVSVSAVSPNKLQNRQPLHMGEELTVLHLAVYDGMFLEDGSGDEVIGVTAVELENRGQTMLEWGRVVLQTPEGNLDFVFTCLPPGQRILVPERSRSILKPASITDIRTQCQSALPAGLTAEQIKVEEIDDISLKITNISGGDLQNLQLYYKQYEAQQGVFLGGSTFLVSVGDLAAGQSATVSPYRYVAGYSRVVSITQTVEN